MTYPTLDLGKPVWSGGGAAFAADIRANLQVFRDYLVASGNCVLPGFDVSKDGGTAAQPAQVYFKRGAEWIRVDLTWGTAGGEAGTVIKAAYYYSANSGGAWDAMTDAAGDYVLTITRAGDGTFDSATWSNTP